jgi:hypothetical protein
MLAPALALLLSVPLASATEPPHDGYRATCAHQSGGEFGRTFRNRPENLVVGPLAMIGAGRFTTPETVEEFGGNKFPLLVKARHTVTVELSRRANRHVSLAYATHEDGRRVADGHRKTTFRACGPRRAQSTADGGIPVTFWSGFVFASRPACVRLKVWIDDRPTPRRARIELGRRC